MKRLAIACSALFFLSFHATAQTYLNCDFEDGIPSSWTLIDNDGNTPSNDAKSQGFAVGTPWITAKPKGEASNVAIATSWYAPSGTSDDWLITPSFTPDADNVRLTWRSRSSMKSTRYHEKYSVYVSTTGGNAIADFDKTAPIFTTDAEPYEWTNHSVDLTPYRGQTISLAFVEEGTNKAYLYLDNINASVWSDLTVKNTLGTQVYSMLPVTPTATVTNRSDATVDGFTASFTIDEQTETKQFTNALAPGESIDISFDNTVTFGHHDKKPYTLTASDATTTYTDRDTITSYGRKILAEEYTGTWCSWCVRGIVAMNKLHEEAKDWFVGIAVHSDVMSNMYSKAVFHLWSSSGFPSGYLGRQYTDIDPGDFEKNGPIALQREPVYSSLEVGASVPDFSARTINTTTTLHFGADYASHKFRIAYAIVENNVHHPADSLYYQYNAAYTGGGAGVMGGWEKLPQTVPSKDMWFHELGRWYDTDINGIDLLPATIKKDEPIVVERTLTIPDSIEIDTLRNCDLVVMLIDNTDNRCVNAEKVQLDPNATPLVDVAARWLSLYSTDGIADISQSPAIDRKPVAYYTIDGRRIDAPRHGITIVRYSDGTSAKILK